MEEAVFMHKSEALQHLVHHVPYYRLGEKFVSEDRRRIEKRSEYEIQIRETQSCTLPVFHQLIEILLHVFEHEVQHVVLPYNFFQLYNVRVTEFLQ